MLYRRRKVLQVSKLFNTIISMVWEILSFRSLTWIMFCSSNDHLVRTNIIQSFLMMAISVSILWCMSQVETFHNVYVSKWLRESIIMRRSIKERFSFLFTTQIESLTFSGYNHSKTHLKVCEYHKQLSSNRQTEDRCVSLQLVEENYL